MQSPDILALQFSKSSGKGFDFAPPVQITEPYGRRIIILSNFHFIQFLPDKYQKNRYAYQADRNTYGVQDSRHGRFAAQLLAE